jgi:hypothetical protein
MAAANKCLAQNNKSSHGDKATKKQTGPALAVPTEAEAFE